MISHSHFHRGVSVCRLMSSLMALGLKKVKEMLASANRLQHGDKAATDTSAKGLIDRIRIRLQKKSWKCEKCRKVSDTCRANESFVSGRKHYLCQGCRTSSDNVKNMYFYWLRSHLGPQESSQTPKCANVMGCSQTCTSREGGMMTQRTLAESGYETGSSSCSSSSLSQQSSCEGSQHHPYQPSTTAHSLQNRQHKHKRQVCGGAFCSEFEHCYDIQSKARPGPPQLKAPADRIVQQTHSTYDGYLVTHSARAPLRYLKHPGNADSCVNVNSSPEKYSQNELKLCTVCGEVKDTAFHLPSHTGWLCEDCMDAVM